MHGRQNIKINNLIWFMWNISGTSTMYQKGGLRDLITAPKLVVQYFDVSYYHRPVVWDVVLAF